MNKYYSINVRKKIHCHIDYSVYGNWLFLECAMYLPSGVSKRFSFNGSSHNTWNIRNLDAFKLSCNL